MAKPHNKIELDHAFILEQWHSGISSDVLAEQLGVSQIVIARHVKEAAGENYQQILAEHWHNLACKRAIDRAGKKTKGGSRWFTADQEGEVIDFFLSSSLSYDDIAKHFNCSRIVIKRLIERRVSVEERKVRLSRSKKGKRLIDYVTIECPACHKTFEVPPWKNQQIYCSRKCKGVATQGENCTWLYGKPNHAVGRWYETSDEKIWLRSRWEYAVVLFLNRLGKRWRYEPTAFQITINGKKTTYTPDFYLVDDDSYIEVKGYWRNAYIAKHKAFVETYPNIKIDIWDKGKLLTLGIVNRKGIGLCGSDDCKTPA